MITLDLTGDGFMQVAVPTAAVPADGAAFVDVSGQIAAPGGRIELRAATVKQTIRDVVNVSGNLSAQSVSGRSGAIVLGGAGGNVAVAGRLDASAGRNVAATDGGTIAVTGDTVAIADGASISAASESAKGGNIHVTGTSVAIAAAALDASGATGSGTILIGGGLRGTFVLPHAEDVTIMAGASLRADATQDGDGGTVVAWSDGTTSVAGTLTAMGAGDGDGGMIETSGHTLNVGGISVNASAPGGIAGTWLLDPYNLTVTSGATTAAESPAGTWTSSAGGSVVFNTDIESGTEWRHQCRAADQRHAGRHGNGRRERECSDLLEHRYRAHAHCLEQRQHQRRHHGDQRLGRARHQSEHRERLRAGKWNGRIQSEQCIDHAVRGESRPDDRGLCLYRDQQPGGGG